MSRKGRSPLEEEVGVRSRAAEEEEAAAEEAAAEEEEERER